MAPRTTTDTSAFGAPPPTTTGAAFYSPSGHAGTYPGQHAAPQEGLMVSQGRQPGPPGPAAPPPLSSSSSSSSAGQQFHTLPQPPPGAPSSQQQFHALPSGAPHQQQFGQQQFGNTSSQQLTSPPQQHQQPQQQAPSQQAWQSPAQPPFNPAAGHPARTDPNSLSGPIASMSLQPQSLQSQPQLPHQPPHAQQPSQFGEQQFPSSQQPGFHAAAPPQSLPQAAAQPGYAPPQQQQQQQPSAFPPSQQPFSPPQAGLTPAGMPPTDAGFSATSPQGASANRRRYPTPAAAAASYGAAPQQPQLNSQMPQSQPPFSNGPPGFAPQSGQFAAPTQPFGNQQQAQQQVQPQQFGQQPPSQFGAGPGMSAPPSTQQPQQPPMQPNQFSNQPSFAQHQQQQFLQQQQQQQQQPGFPQQQPAGFQQPGFQQPQPGFQQQQPGFQQPNQQLQQQQGGFQQAGKPPQKQSRIDPNHIPSPVAVMEGDQQTFDGVAAYIASAPVAGLAPSASFTGATTPTATESKHIPPLASTTVRLVDDGNCTPRFMRATINNVPISEELLNKTKLPFGVIVTPMVDTTPGEQPIYVADHGTDGPVRCNRCKAYINCHVTFIDGGRAFVCNLCSQKNEVPAAYFCNLDHTGRRLDVNARPELRFGSVEFAATKDYYNRPPLPPAYVFVIDVSWHSVHSGVLLTVIQAIKSLLDSLPAAVPVESPSQPGDDRIDSEPTSSSARATGRTRSPVKVGFITYDRAVHFHNLNPSLTQSQMLIVSDVTDVFLPLAPEGGLLVDAFQSRSLIESFLDRLPQQFHDTKQSDPAIGPALQAAHLAAKDRGGKVLFFQTTLPSSELPGKLTRRDDVKLLGTDKENTIIAPNPTDTFYRKLATDCTASGVSVDLFLLSPSYLDVATVSQVSALTGGSVYHYPNFTAALDGERLFREIRYTVTRTTGYDALMRLRCSNGLRAVEFFGNFSMRNTTDMELAGIDADKAIGIQLRHDDTLSERQNAYLQLALLYTNAHGQRRIRVHNIALRISNVIQDVFRHAEMDTILNFIAKQADRDVHKKPLRAVRDHFSDLCIAILTNYRKHCAANSSPGQLILPEALKLLPVYTNALLKCDAFRGGSAVAPDIRAATLHALSCMAVSNSIPFFYPRLLCATDARARDVVDDRLPRLVRTSYERLDDTQVYLCENGVYLFVWVGRNTSSELLQSLFGVPTFQAVDTTKTSLSAFDNPISSKMRLFVDILRRQRLSSRFLRMSIVKQQDASEVAFLNMLAEDKGPDTMSYVDYLCHIHRIIQADISTNS
ncbi:protein transporter Sec24-like CEF [Capsaspora owczarzaki ATCC 30864]|nr:protein transporter Sec24-like CEF [Capsaspora owczarzaki ATCC 30864]|eukprot:XP_004346230.1 protein transporter Sec24-like CEF [Capsaspora owczarzaki ATCC 30864]